MNMPAVTSTPDIPLAKIPLNQLRPYVNQRRKLFDPAALKQLAESIKTLGVAQPIIVRTAKPGKDGTKTIEPYEIIAGERRWRASAMAGLDAIPAMIRDDLDDAGAEALHLVENLQRADLTLEEQCDGAVALVALVGFEKACEQSGQTEAWMSQHTRLTDLEPEVQALVRKGHVGSLETAHSIQQLKVYDPKVFNQTVGEFDQANKWARAPSRENLRRRVRDAKEAYDEKKKKAEAKKKEQDKLREQLKKDPKLKEKLAAEKAQSPEAKRKEREIRARALNTEGEGIEKDLTNKLLQLSGFDLTKPAKKGRRDNPPVYVEMRGRYSNYGHDTLPASAESGEFSVSFCGGIDVIGPALNLIAPGAKVELSSHVTVEFTQDEARKIEKAIGRPLDWEHYAKSQPAKKLRITIDNAQNAGKAGAATAAGKPGANHSVLDFMAINIVKKNGAKIKASDLHERYSTWCEENGRKHEILPPHGGANEFGAAFDKAKIERKREKTGYVYLGIEFKA